MKQIAYIIPQKTTMLLGLAYFVEDRALDYEVVHYESAEILLGLTPRQRQAIGAIVIDAELSATCMNHEQAYDALTKVFHLVPVIQVAYLQNLTDPEEMLDYLLSRISYYRPTWINDDINRVLYSVTIFTGSLQKKSCEEKFFYHPDPWMCRQEAIRYYQENYQTISIDLYGFSINKHLETMVNYPAKGRIVLSGILNTKHEYMAQLHAEYLLYQRSGFPMEGYTQTLYLPGWSEPIYILKGMTDEEGTINLK